MQNLTANVDHLRNEIADVIKDPDQWLDTPNNLLGGRKPIDLLNSNSAEKRKLLEDLVESIKRGQFS